jgi:glycosyltransferase involved in cell wall biosynthesis
MKVGIVEPIGGHGGMDYYDYGLASGLGASGVDVYLYTSSETDVRFFDHVTTYRVFDDMWKRTFLVKSFKYVLGHLKAFYHFKKRKGTIVHLHFFSFRNIDLMVLLISNLFGFRVIGTIHDVNSFEGKSKKWIERLCLKFINVNIVHNQTSLDALLNKHPQLLSRSRIVPHGNYLPFVKPVGSLGRNGSQLKLLFFGQIKKVKGLGVLLEAMNILTKRNVDVQLRIAGRPWKDDPQEYTDQILKFNLGEKVLTDFRYIDDSEVEALYAECDLVVLPYKEIYQSGVLLLSMSYGKPIICSNLPAFGEIISHGKNGYLFDVGSSTDLANQIQQIAKNKFSLLQVAREATKTIETEYNWEDIGIKMKKIYAG